MGAEQQLRIRKLEAENNELDYANGQLSAENAELRNEVAGDSLGYLKRIRDLKAELAQANQWVHDLQAGMYINCVYCGHRYGREDEVEAMMQRVLYDHIKVCPKHPLSKALAENTQLKEELKLARKAADA